MKSARSTRRPCFSLLWISVYSVVFASTASDSWGQSRVRLPGEIDPYAAQAQPWSTPLPPYTPPNTAVPPTTYPPATNFPPATSFPPATTLPTVPAPAQLPGNVTLGPQIVPFDPYSTVPAVPPLVGVPGGYPGVPLPPASIPPSLPPSSFPGAAPIYPPSAGGYGPPPPLNPGVGGYPQQTPVFPNGINWNSGAQRLFQDTGFRYTFLNGDNNDDLEMHDVELFTTLVVNTWGRSPTGLRITPGFIFHFLDGPATGSDLPAQLYSAYVQGAWAPQFTPQFGADLAFRTGVYSDFNTVTFHSIRFTGHGLGVVQITPTVSFKLGGEYLDRAKIKLLPAGGIVWTPDPQSRYDISFPSPKLAHYWRPIGNAEVWWYLGGEYGGGSWTINREDNPMINSSERIDINDIRVFAGIEWAQTTYRTGFLELGYVFDREVIYKVVPSESMSPSNTLMVRGGLAF